MEEKILYWLDGKLMGERTEDEMGEIIKVAEASGYEIHQRPGHILVYTAEGEKQSMPTDRNTGGRSR